MKKTGERGICRELFLSTFTLSAVTFGGGYVIVPLMKKSFVEERGWISEEEMLNLVAIGQSAPGPIVVNTALLAGYHIAGFSGAVAALLGTMLPPMITLSVVAVLYAYIRNNAMVEAVMKGMQAGIAAVIAEVVLSMGGGIVKTRDAVSVLVMVSAFCAIYFFGVHVALIIAVCGALGAVRVLLRQRKGAGK